MLGIEEIEENHPHRDTSLDPGPLYAPNRNQV